MPEKTPGFHFGDWLRKAVASRGIPLNKFAVRLGVSEPTLHGWLGKAAPKIRGSNIGKIAKELGISIDVVEAEMGYEDTDLPRGVDQYGLQIVVEVPAFDLSLAAGPWSDISDVQDIVGPDSITQGLFRVRISGDSMSPEYQSGTLVEFQCLRFGIDPVIVGKDYYVQKDDGTATFKRVQSATQELLTLRAINKKNILARCLLSCRQSCAWPSPDGRLQQKMFDSQTPDWLQWALILGFFAWAAFDFRVPRPIVNWLEKPWGKKRE